MHRHTPTIFNWHITVYLLRKVQRDLSNHSRSGYSNLSAQNNGLVLQSCLSASHQKCAEELQSQEAPWYQQEHHTHCPAVSCDKKGLQLLVWHSDSHTVDKLLPACPSSDIWLFRETILFSLGRKPSPVTMLCSRIWEFSWKLLKTQSSTSQHKLPAKLSEV